MYKINEFLLELGMNGKEIQSYLSLLELGEQPASIIAKKIKIPRSSALFLLNSLVEKGFAIKKCKSANLSHFSAIQPHEIKHLLDHRKQKLDQQMKKFETLSPELANIAKNFLPQSKIGYFDGIEGTLKMIDLLFEKDTPLYFISAHDLHPEIRKYIREVYAPARSKMTSKCQMIVVKKPESEDYVSITPDVYEWVGFIEPKSEAENLKSTFVIFENKIELLSLNGDFIGGILIENDYLAKTLLAIFNILKNSHAVKPPRKNKKSL